MTTCVRSAFEKLKESKVQCSHAEMLEAVQKERRTQSISAWETVFEDMYIVKNLQISDVYSIFTFESLQNIHLGREELMKD